MSYIRFGEPRRYFEGDSDMYVYPSGSGEVTTHMGETTEKGLAELSLRVIEQTDVSDETFEEVVQAVTEHYPKYDD